MNETHKKHRLKRYLRLFRNRRRGTAIVMPSKGLLVVSHDGKIFHLPGGAAKGNESRKEATIRELEEETGLKVEECSYLFAINGRIHRDIKGGFFRDAHKVFLMKTSGVAHPKNEIKHIAYTTNNVNLTYTTKVIKEKFFNEKMHAENSSILKAR